MDLESRYEQAIAEQGLADDPAQRAALGVLAEVGSALARRPRAGHWSHRLRRSLGRRPLPPVPGAYLWGGVGRGKTFLMDLFFASLPFPDKLRQHFHRLMYRVHGRLRQLRDRPDPLGEVADELAAQARLLCFDEFFVSDIADAMILGRLLDGLFERGVTLVSTSNIPPDGLYEGGLQRQRFLPAIDLIKQHARIVHVDGALDYRLRLLERAEIYHSPLDPAAERNLADYFRRMAPDAGSEQPIEILGRDIAVRRRADGIAWFDFAALCDGPRSQDDYIELARCFQTILLANLPVLDEQQENQARRFIALVDELYDHRVKLIISAATPIESLYRGYRLRREFERTRSRLLEMQSHDYLAAAHVP